MSTPTLLPAIFKGAPEVTSLASTDRFLTVDANGNPQKITRVNAIGGHRTLRIAGPQWVRIAKFSSVGYALLTLFSEWGTTAGQKSLLDVMVHPHASSYCKCTVLSKMHNSGSLAVFSKIRFVVKRESMCYIDAYYTRSDSNQIRCSLAGNVSLELVDIETNAEIPDGYSATEVDITHTAWGG